MQGFREQLHRQIEKEIQDLVAPSPLLASMRAQIEGVVAPSPLCASMRAQIASIQRAKEDLRRWGFSFPEECRVTEVLI